MHSKLDLNNQKTPEEIVICREQLSQSHMYTVRLLFSIRVEDLKHSQNMFSCHFFKKPVGFFFFISRLAIIFNISLKMQVSAKPYQPSYSTPELLCCFSSAITYAYSFIKERSRISRILPQT